jgi:hypothetical protein
MVEGFTGPGGNRLLTDAIARHSTLHRTFDCLDDRAMMFIVGPEFENFEDLRHHAPVMTFVRIPGQSPQRGPILRRRLSLLHELLQGLLAYNREYDLTHSSVRPLDGGAGELEQ